MKKLYLSLTLFFVVFLLQAQTPQDLKFSRIDKQKTGMIVLGSWAVANLVSSPILASRTNGSTKYFHQMNGFWNTVNLTLAVVGYLGLPDAATGDMSWSAEYQELIKIEKILLFNTALDLGYMATGFYLRERANNVQKQSARFRGFGNSLILQGGFLFLFDLIFYTQLHQLNAPWVDWMQNLSFTGNTVGIVLRF
jgi:hypothetical protein